MMQKPAIFAVLFFNPLLMVGCAQSWGAFWNSGDAPGVTSGGIAAPRLNPQILNWPDTAQVQCSSGAAGNGTMTTCPSIVTGQDGEFANTPAARSYTGPTAHGTFTSDFTTIDNTTGLVWRSCQEGKTGGACTGSATTYTWENAKAACLALNNLNGGQGYAARSNWRLPMTDELLTIPNLSLTNPAITTANFPGNVNLHWTLNSSVSDETKAWYVGFFYGETNPSPKTNLYAARCVAASM